MPNEQDEFRHPGRWILSPRRGSRFVGSRARAQLRARERRRGVYLVLLEAIGLTGLIGMFPPLRGMLFVTGFLALLLLAYLVLVLKFTRGRVPSPAAETPERVVALPSAGEPFDGLAEDREPVRIAAR